MSGYGTQICKQCERVTHYLKYGLCETCFQKWHQHDNPEPEARKIRATTTGGAVSKNNRRGCFVVRIKPDRYHNSKKAMPVPSSEATMYHWLNSARAIAEQVKGKVEELKPAKIDVDSEQE